MKALIASVAALGLMATPAFAQSPGKNPTTAMTKATPSAAKGASHARVKHHATHHVRHHAKCSCPSQYAHRTHKTHKAGTVAKKGA